MICRWHIDGEGKVVLVVSRNILVTGCTALQVGSTHRVIEKLDVPAGFVKLLRDAGHTVDWRKVPVGEDVSQYDCAIVCMAPAQSLGARHVLGATWVLGQDIPAIAFYDDWKTTAMVDQMRNLARRADIQLFKKLGEGPREGYLYAEDMDKVQEHRELILSTAEEFGTTVWNRWHALIPTYPWGDKERAYASLGCQRSVADYVDPSPLVDRPDRHAGVQKGHKWVLASLSDQTDWVKKLGLTWPVDYFGARKIEAPRLKTELDIMREYEQSWGALAAPYFHSGSGWFRTRYLYSAWAGSVIHADKGDSDAIGEGYYVEPRAVEAMGEDELRATAEQQSALFTPWLWSEDQLQSALVDKVERCMTDKANSAQYVFTAPKRVMREYKAQAPRAPKAPKQQTVRPTKQPREQVARSPREKPIRQPRVTGAGLDPHQKYQVRLDERVEVQDQESGLWYRTETPDFYTIGESRSYVSLGMGPDDLVLDLGGHIGIFVWRAMSEGVKHVWTFEPEPDNFALLEKNTQQYGERVSAFRQAVVSTGDTEVKFFLNSGRGTTRHSTYARRGRPEITVPAVDFQLVLERTKPTVVKCDIEGGEFYLDLTFPESVTKLALECHFNDQNWRYTETQKVLEKIRSQGFSPVKDVRVTDRNWSSLGIWRRAR